MTNSANSTVLQIDGFTMRPLQAMDLDALVAIWAESLPENIASRRVIEKAGLHHEKSIHMFNLDVLYYSAEPIRC
jgi:RimJ/RimL family protein N-acetyltransferase